MSRKVLIDTCAWIDFLRSTQGALGDYVEQAIRTETAVLCSVTVAELLQGAKGNKEKQQLDYLLANIECLTVEENDWIKAGMLLQNLREKGVTVPLTDALIAVVAQRHKLPVCTVDKHFQHLSVEVIAPV